MKPKKLKIKGLNSFVEEVIIDFEKLTEKGIFGIFGPTGSGKSSILDAITISLYGELARNTTEFINSDCDVLSVSYEFEIGAKKDRKRYIADRSLRRDKKDKAKYKTTSARLIDVSDNENKVIAEGANDVKKNVEDIVGLTYNDFTRSVVLPQGKFSDFLKLTGKDRRDMLERIFALQKYGRNLGERIRRAKNENSKRLDILEGELRAQDGVTEESIKEVKEELKKVLAREISLKIEKKLIDEKHESLKSLWQLQNEIKEYINKLNLLESKKADVERKELIINRNLEASTVKPFIDNMWETEKKLEINRAELILSDTKLINLESSLKETEISYSIALEDKNKELPTLFNQEAKFNEAVEIKANISTIEKEMLHIISDKESYDGKSSLVKKEFEDIQNDIKICLDEILETENRINEIKIDPKYREKVAKAFSKGEEYVEVYKVNQEIKRKLKDKVKSEEINKLNHEKLLIRIKDKALGIEKIILEINELQKHFPGDNSILLQKHSQLNILSEQLKRFLEIEKIMGDGSLKLNLLEDKICQSQINYDEVNLSIKDKKEEFIAIEKQINKFEIERLASTLSIGLSEGDSCPVCGSIHHPNLANVIEVLKSDELKKIKDVLEGEIKLLETKERGVFIELSKFNNDKTRLLEEKNNFIIELQGIDIEDLKFKNQRSQKEFEELKLSMETWNKSKDEKDKRLNELKEEKIEIDKEEVLLGETLKQEKLAIEEIKGQLEMSDLKFQEVKNILDGLKQEIGVESIKAETEKINAFDKENVEKEGNLKILKERISELEKKKESLGKVKNSIEIEIIKLEQIINEKRLRLEELNSKLFIISRGQDPVNVLNLIKNKILEINTKEEKLKLRLEKERKETQLIKDKKVSAELTENTLLRLRFEQNEKLNKNLEKYNFKNELEVLSFIVEIEKINRFREEVLKFQEDYTKIKNNIESLNKKLNGESVLMEEWESIQIKKEEILNSYNDIIKLSATTQNLLENMEKKLIDLEALLKSKKEFEHKGSLLEDLDKLVQGNKFVEFVAMNQLEYISKEASTRLKDITKGRYALELDSSGNFTMRDDFNGGTVRATSTLSGGETFLTSLALALSLSSQIQLKGSAPLEFFFLDEGFGTLDSDLLETVISSLERLHNDRLSIGIISHVEELKNRVPIKLILEAAEAGKGGSTVKIEVS